MPDETVTFGPLTQAAFNLASTTVDAWIAYNQALLTIAGADGEVSEPEMAWLIDTNRRHGAPQVVLDAIAAFDWQTADFSDLIGRITAEGDVDPKRLVLYGAIKMARADEDYAVDERVAVERAKRLLEVPHDVLHELHMLILEEEHLAKRRYALLGTQGND